MNVYESVACPECDAEAGERCAGMTLAELHGWGVHAARVTRYFDQD